MLFSGRGLSRRSFIVGTGSAALLAACGSDSGSSDDVTVDGFALARRFPTTITVPGDVRLAVSLVENGTLTTTGPAELLGAILDADDNVVVEMTAVRRSAGLENPYYDFRATIDTIGIYTLRAEGDDGDGAAFEVLDPARVTMPHVGFVMPPFDTPTFDDGRGVNPICSRIEGPCPLHDVTLTEALASGLPVVYMVGTPAFCQTGTCGPGLEFLMVTAERVGGAAAFVHADVWTDDTATIPTDAVNSLGLTYEPVLYLCRADGTIVEHLDGVWDQSELDEAVDRLVAIS